MSHEDDGRIRVLRRLAAGGTSEVFLAERADAAGGEPFVLKRLFANYAQLAATRAMFLHEARVLASLAHPAVPALRGVWADGPAPAMAMDFVPGTDLATLARARALPREAALGVVLELLGALAHAHERRDARGEPLRVVHHDVAPANVRLTPRGAVALIDFGLATSVHHAPAPDGALRGTPGYVAPEVLTGGAGDARADLFSAGVILYELTVGARLFPGGALAALHATVEAPLPAPAARAPGYPRELESVVLRALARSPEDRFASAADMRSDLARASLAAGVDPDLARSPARLSALLARFSP